MHNRFRKSKNRTIMKKSILLSTFLLLLSSSSFAQIGGIEDSVNDVSDTIRTIFPIILGVIFLIGFLFNAGHFFGENADLKKGITRVLVFVLIAGAVVGIFTYLISIVV
ncbi:TrbC/VirB2 family protein [Mariniflexile aquimaris]|uniref:TrbC/VirB2 family protein n=1 Tax=Mariniflexile aquimaris TaxID=881009 RepID=A0ABW3BV63_9FLAO